MTDVEKRRTHKFKPKGTAKTRGGQKRKPRVMIAGEFSAGKTQLISGLLGDTVLPSNVTATALPPVWITSGEAGLRAVDLDDEVTEIPSLDDVTVDKTKYCIMSHMSPVLEHVDIIDTPGNSDPNIPPESWERMLDFADVVIWCTNATQAWRQSEKAVWNEMPERLQAKALLLITHADRIVDERSSYRILRRIKRETQKYFSSLLMVSLLREDDIARVQKALSEIVKDLGALNSTENDLINSDAAAQAPKHETIDEPAVITPRRVKAYSHAERALALSETDGDDTVLDNELAEEQFDMSEPETTPMELGPFRTQADPSDDESEPSLDDVAEAELCELFTSDDNPVHEPQEEEPLTDLFFEEFAEENASFACEAESEDIGEENVFASSEDAPTQDPASSQPVRTLWEGLVQDVDLSNADNVIECVERLILLIDKPGSSNEGDSPKADQVDDLISDIVKRI